MKKPQQQPNMLTVTYFVNPDRKREFQISLSGLRLVMLAGTLFGFASLISLIWLSTSVNQDPGAAKVIDTMAASINAAPESATTLLAATAARSGIAAGLLDNSERVEPQALQGPVESKLLATTEPKSLSETIGISNPAFLYRSNRLETNFAVMNHSAKAAQGTVWGVATFETENGTTITVPSHNNLDLSALEDMRPADQGTPYKAKNLSNKSLSFVLPENQIGHFTEVKIAISEHEHAQLVVATFALGNR